MMRLLTTVFAFVIIAVRVHAFDVDAFVTPKGIEVWHVEERTVPLISMTYAFETGSLTDPEGKEGTAYLLSGLLEEGAGNLSGEVFREKRDDNSVRLGFQATADQFTGSMQTPSANAAVAFDLLKLAITAPTIPPEALERTRQQAMVGAMGRINSPSDIAFQEAGKLVMPGHPYLRNSQGLASSIPLITRDDILAARLRMFTRTKLKVAVVGAISKQEIIAYVDAVFGELPQSTSTFTVETPAPITGAVTKVLDWDMPQTFVLFGSNGVRSVEPDYRAAQILYQIVGGDAGRLTQEIREKRGLTYGVGLSSFAYSKVSFSAGSMAVENARAGDAVKVLKEVLADVAAKGVTEEEVAAAKLYLKGQFAFFFENSGATAATLLNFMTQDLSPTYHKVRNTEVDATRLEDVNAVAKRILDVNKLVVVAIGKPEGMKGE
jgi:zinc protease